MSAKTIEAARIAGAQTCLDALRRLEQAAEAGDPGDTAAEYYAQRLSDARALVAAIGPMTPEQEGAIAVLAEYIHMNLTTGTPNLAPGGWIPLSAMTDTGRREQANTSDVKSHQATDEDGRHQVIPPRLRPGFFLKPPSLLNKRNLRIVNP